MDMKKAAVVVGAGLGVRALYMLFTGQTVTLKSVFFMEDSAPRTYGSSSFTPYVPGATAPGPFALPAAPPVVVTPDMSIMGLAAALGYKDL